ncbi:hypothetical protein [Streptococcus merionis]|uniref:hypothetical protein n=1 Tax=Streptococcus merionis TaxID=400065 RepID=UPI0026EFC73A|nr:hypothetical protein [Streptococcus merionis]
MGSMVGRQLASRGTDISFGIFWGIVLIYICLAIVFILHIAIHEAGHVIFGLLTGYQFLSYRVLNLMWRKKADGKIAFSRYSVPGTAGQALMIPPDPKDDKIPYVLYNLGGGLANLIASGLVYLFLYITNMSNIYLEIFGMIGMLTGLGNLIPVTGFIANDGANIVHIAKHPKGSLYFWSNLAINARLSEGDAYSDLDKRYFLEVRNEDLNNNIVASSVFSNVSLLMDQNQAGVMDIIKVLGKVTIVYCDMLLEQAPTHTFNKKEWKIIQALSRSQPSVLVMLYAYYNLIEPDSQKAAKALAGFKKMEATYHLPAEYRTEARNLGYFQEIITRKVY